jgi:hypothetical protein
MGQGLDGIIEEKDRPDFSDRISFAKKNKSLQERRKG